MRRGVEAEIAAGRARIADLRARRDVSKIEQVGGDVDMKDKE
jgi:hypothetical protein